MLIAADALADADLDIAMDNDRRNTSGRDRPGQGIFSRALYWLVWVPLAFVLTLWDDTNNFRLWCNHHRNQARIVLLSPFAVAAYVAFGAINGPGGLASFWWEVLWPGCRASWGFLSSLVQETLWPA